MLKIIGTALLTAFLTSMFWIWFYNFLPASAPPASHSKPAASSNGGSAVPAAPPHEVQVEPSGLAIPVVGIKADQLTDTFDAARAEGRRHDAIDIMAPERTSVIAAADGTVEKLFNSARGGITIYERSKDRHWEYYYAHLLSYAPGLHEGQQLKRGDVIGLVGHTGDANAAGPHLHFAINSMATNDHWWNGTPINPYPLLSGKTIAG